MESSTVARPSSSPLPDVLPEIRNVQQQSEIFNINWLPVEILENIFSYLSQSDTITIVWHVCKRWRSILCDWVLNRGLLFCGPTIPTEEALCVLGSLPKLQSLQLEKRSDAYKILEVVAGQCNQLQHLAVIKCHCNADDKLHAFLDVFTSCLLLTNLTVKDTYVADGTRLCQELGKQLLSLRSLNFNGCVWFGGHQLRLVIASCSQLEELRADKCYLGDEDLVALVDRSGPSLKALELGARNLTYEGLQCLEEGCPRLEDLSLSCGLGFSDTELRQVSKLSHLRRLQLSDVRVCTDECACEFFANSSSRARLREISLHSCAFVNDSVLCAIVANCSVLKKLYLSFCAVAVDGECAPIYRNVAC